MQITMLHDSAPLYKSLQKGGVFDSFASTTKDVDLGPCFAVGALVVRRMRFSVVRLWKRSRQGSDDSRKIINLHSDGNAARGLIDGILQRPVIRIIPGVKERAIRYKYAFKH